LKALLQDSSTDDELRTLAEEDIKFTEEALPKLASDLSASLIPPDPLSKLPCIVEIRPGAGGDEAALFAGDLLRMYMAFCSRHRLQSNILKLETTEGEGGDGVSLANASVQEAVLEVGSPGAYELFRHEAGVHRVQRVPATETKGRTHTSGVAVLVLPSMPEKSTDTGEADPNSDYYVDPSEVRTDVMRSKGAGGQHVNKTESAVRLTHEPTGTVVRMEDGRSQHKNREAAWKILRSRIADKRRQEREAKSLAIRRDVIGANKMGREDKIRTYNYGQQRVNDHRSGFGLNRLDDVMEGGESLDSVVESVQQLRLKEQVEALMKSI
jgi:peptide chain release factor 1